VALVSAYGATLDTWGHVAHIFTIIDIVGIALSPTVQDVGESWQARGGRRGTASRGKRRPCLGTAPGGMQTGTGVGGRTEESEPARGARAGRAGGVWVGGGVP